MAEETLVAGSLVPAMIRGGQQIVESLEREKYPLKGAFWLLAPYQTSWQLFLVSDEVARVGRLKTYERILKFAPTHPVLYWPSRIAVHSSHESEMRDLRKAIKAAGFEGEPVELLIRLSSSEVGRAYLYKIW